MASINKKILQKKIQAKNIFQCFSVAEINRQTFFYPHHFFFLFCGTQHYGFNF